MKRDFVNKENGQIIGVDLSFKHDSKGEKIYKFQIYFPDGRMAVSDVIINIGRPYSTIGCYLHDDLGTVDPNFFMSIHPYALFTQSENEIDTICLETKNGKRKATYTLLPE